MKRTTNNYQPKTLKTLNQQKQTEQLECSCEILNDTSLSEISSQSCDCSDCLQANLNAFNDLQNLQETQNRLHDKTSITKRHSKSQQPTNIQNKKTKRITNQNRNNLNSNKTTNQSRATNRINVRDKDLNNNEDHLSESHDKERHNDHNQYTNEELNDFLYITKNRTRKYIQERNNMQLNQKQQKSKLKDQIKANLEVLKMTAELMRSQGEKEINQNEQISHPYKWNHSKYVCECNQQKKNCDKFQQKQQSHDCSRKKRVRKQLDTNMSKIHQGFMENRQMILNGLKKERIESLKPGPQKCPYDKCLNHHNRTSEKKIEQIQKFIMKQAKKQKRRTQKQKKQKQEEKLTKQAKLRAIDIKAKEIVTNSRRYDGNISRTSFRLSIEQFDTFSELREEKEKMKQIRRNKQKVKQQLKKGGAQLQQQIYENLQEQEDQFSNYMNHHKDQNLSQNKQSINVQKQQLDPQNNQHYSSKILYDAKIKDPANLKRLNKVQKTSGNKLLTQNNASNNSNHANKKRRQLSKTKEEEERRRLQKQINRKKKQILEEYSKRNTKASNNTKNTGKNKKLREQYSNNIKQANSRNLKSSDSYRKNYKYQASKDINQINAHGDPLLQQYVSHDGERLKAVTKVRSQYGKQKQQIFTQNINSLTGKTKLKL